MEAKPTSFYLAPGLLAVGALLAAANWYADPRQALTSVVALVLLGLMAVVLRLFLTPPSSDAARRQTQDSIRSGIVFAGLMVVVSLGAKLSSTLGNAGGREFPQRALMVILGAFLVFTGNAIPKTLAPLSGMHCDATRVQAFQRFAGWTWVLAGLVFTIGWLALPVLLADRMTVILLPGVMLVILAQLVHLRLTRQRSA
jgi:hypothetical protein